MAIPRLIHQTCKDKRALPDEILASIERMCALHPGWEHRLYENRDFDAFIHAHYGADVLGIFQRINPKYGPALSDVFRYLLLYRLGGVYLDIKSTLVKPLDAVLLPADQFLLSQWRNRLGEPFQGWGLHPELAGVPGGEFQQWHIAAAPGHPFLARAIERALHNIRTYDAAVHGVGHLGVLRTTGPICYTLAIAPHLGAAPFRIVDAQALGLRYSIYPDPHAHQTMLFPDHYTRLTEPVVL